MTDSQAASRDLVPHGLGQPHATCARLAGAAVQALHGEGAGHVALARLGEALVAPIHGVEYDPSDDGDRDLLVTVLVRWQRRIARQGADLGVPDLAAGRVWVSRSPRRGDDIPIKWADIASRSALARWAVRAATPAAPEPAGPRLRGGPVLADALRARPGNVADVTGLPVIDARPVWIRGELVLLPVRPR